MKDEPYEALEKLFLNWEHRIARGELSDGNYHYLTAITDADAECGWSFYERVVTPEAYTGDEYNRRPGAPVTLAIYNSQSPYDSRRVWDEYPDGWSTCKYAHLPDDWEDYIYLGAGYSDALLEAMDSGLIGERDLPDSEEGDLAILKAEGFIPFDLGDFSGPVDVVEQVAEALRDLRAAAARVEET